MKAVLISIRPQWCELIASGKKTLEVRKTRPKLETPFKVYIYCTKDKKGWFHFGKKQRLDGMVIGEFVCDRIDRKTPDCLIVKEDREQATAGSCLTAKEIRDYVRGNRTTYNLADLPDFYCWHISNLVIYGEPKPLSDFRRPCDNDLYCKECGMYSENRNRCGNGALQLARPPQSWCYVEELKCTPT